MNELFKYNSPDIPNCKFRISPSSIGDFFSYPAVWYKDHILKQKTFTASTSTVLGTVVHAAAESFVTDVPFNRDIVEEYITEMAANQPITEDAIALETIRNCYPGMAMTLVNDYLRYNRPTEVERTLYTEILDGIYVGGTFDNLTGDTVVDYKTYNSATKPTKLSFNYKIQALAYAYMLRAEGKEINRIRLVYVNRPIDGRYISEKTGKQCGKVTPPGVTVLTEVITPEDWDLISKTLELMALTILRAEEDPTLVPLLFKSMNLKKD